MSKKPAAKKMNYSDVINNIAETHAISKETVKTVLGGLVQQLTDNLHSDTATAIHGLGTFKVRKTNARTGRNPQTGAPLNIPAKKSLAFDCTSSLKTDI